MKKLLIIIGILTSLASNAQDRFTDNYPLKVGNVFVYGRTSESSHSPATHRIIRIIIINDTIVNGKKYYKFTEGNTSTFYRIDSLKGTLKILSSTSCSGFYDVLRDSLLSELHDSARSCRGHYINCNQSGTKILFGSTVATRSFIESYIPSGGFFSQERRYAKGFGLIYSYTTFTGGGQFGRTTDTIRGCLINGIVYGDTSMTTSVGIIKLHNEVSEKFLLSQNYPNPFNPETSIKFEIPVLSQTEFVIFDMLGKEIYKESKNLSAGSYQFKWDAANYSSGIYFYKITAEGYTETKKMILMK